MIEFTSRQQKTIAAAITGIAATTILAIALITGWVLLKFFSIASSAIVPVILGAFLAMLFKPYYDWIRWIVRNPSLSFIVMMLSIFVPAGFVIWYGGSFFVSQIGHLVEAAPSVIPRFSAWVNETFPNVQQFAAQCGASADVMAFFTAPELFVQNSLRGITSTYGAEAVMAGLNIFTYLSGAASFLITLLFFACFVTAGSNSSKDPLSGEFLVGHMPFLKDTTKGFVSTQIDSFCTTIVTFFRTQFIICFLEGICYGLGFFFAGLPSGFVLGFLLGLLNLAPFFGSVLVMPIALPMAYFGDGGSMTRLLIVLSVWLTMQLLDGYLITPKIQGDKMKLGYAGVIFSFFFWSLVFHSVLGLLLAIPLSAFCVTFWRALKEHIKGVF